MNFYTLNSNKIKIVAAIVVFITLMIALNLTLNLYVSSKTTQHSWIENKLSKSKHFQLLSQHDLDYVFIGSSRTIFHIDTALFKQRGLDIYNFGVSGMVLTDYPHFVHKAIKAKPKAIVMNMSVQQLYHPSMQDDFKQVTATDLHYIYKTQSWAIKRDATVAYIKHWHGLLGYAEAIYIRIKQFLRRFTITIPSAGSPEDIDVTQPLRGSDIGCKIFDINIVSEHKTVLKCSNGDGILLGNFIEDGDDGEIKSLLHLNPDFMRLLNALVKTIQAANIKPIIVLEPILNYHYSYDLGAIRQKLSGIEMHDLTRMHGFEEYWADPSHFNHKGRAYYSDVVSDILSSR